MNILNFVTTDCLCLCERENEVKEIVNDGKRCGNCDLLVSIGLSLANCDLTFTPPSGIFRQNSIQLSSFLTAFLFEIKEFNIF